MKNKKVIYLMGAGRSGTTALATFLGNSELVFNAGELHQLNEHVLDNKRCSCGLEIIECKMWSTVLSNISYLQGIDVNKVFIQDLKIEKHSSIIKHLLNTYSKKELKAYISRQESLFDSISHVSKRPFTIDSSKYIGRVLALRKSKHINLKVIYVVRDVRGVINSFAKSVQTQRSPLSTIVYYSIINMVAEVVCRILPKSMVMKVRYEAFIQDPDSTFDDISSFLGCNLDDIKSKVSQGSSFSIGHIIGGNRLKLEGSIKFKKDLAWQKSFSKAQSILYYVLTLPFMLINRFKL